MPWWILWLAVGLAQPVALERADAARCGWDDHEPNDVRRRARAVEREAAGAVCLGDEDWFSMRLERGQLVEVVVRHHGTARFRPPEVYAPRARRPRGQVFKAFGRVGVRLKAKRTGVYRVRIRTPEPVRAAYSLGVGPPSKAPPRRPLARYPATVAGKLSTRR